MIAVRRYAVRGRREVGARSRSHLSDEDALVGGREVAAKALRTVNTIHDYILEKRAAAILQTDAAVCGGITEFRKIAALADGFGVTMCPHWFHDLHVHLVASTPNARFVEFFPDEKVFNFREIIDRQLTVRNGGLALSTEPGLGYRMDLA